MNPFNSLFELLKDNTFDEDITDNIIKSYCYDYASNYGIGAGAPGGGAGGSGGCGAADIVNGTIQWVLFVPVAMILLPVAMASLIGLINMRNFEIEAGATALRVGLVVSCGVALTRFRSNGLSMMDMVYIVIATATGIALGIGYALYAVITAIIFIAILLVLHKMHFGENKEGIYTLKYEVGEDLNDHTVFEEAIKKHCDAFTLVRVRTVEYGQLYEMRYSVSLMKGHSPKDLIDEVRLHNANLNVTLCLEDKE